MKITITDDDDYETEYTINDSHLIEYIKKIVNSLECVIVIIILLFYQVAINN